MITDPENSEVQPHSWRSLHPNVKWLGVASLVNDIASEMIYPLLPSFFLSVLGGSRLALGFMEGLGESVASILKLATGSISDRWRSRKGLIVSGYAISALARPLVGVAAFPWHVLTLRTADRVGKGIRTAPRDAMIADSTHESIRGAAYGFHRSMDHLGAAIGPLLAAALLWLMPGQLRFVFLLTAVPAVIVCVVVFFRVKELDLPYSPVLPNEPKTSSRLGKPFLSYIAAVGLFTLANASDTFVLVRLEEIGVPLWFLPILWSAFHVVKSVGSYWGGQFADRYGARLVIVLGWMVFAAVYGGLAFAESVAVGVALFLAYGVYYSLAEPAEKKMVASLAPSEVRGSAFGWFHFTIGVIAFPSSLLFGWLYEVYGAVVAFGASAAIALLSSFLLLFLVPQVSPDHNGRRASGSDA